MSDRLCQRSTSCTFAEASSGIDAVVTAPGFDLYVRSVAAEEDACGSIDSFKLCKRTEGCQWNNRFAEPPRTCVASPAPSGPSAGVDSAGVDCSSITRSKQCKA